jgi:hypothetical protein
MPENLALKATLKCDSEMLELDVRNVFSTPQNHFQEFPFVSNRPFCFEMN